MTLRLTKLYQIMEQHAVISIHDKKKYINTFLYKVDKFEKKYFNNILDKLLALLNYVHIVHAVIL